MKLQFFSLTPSVPGVNMLRLKDGVYSRVPLLPGAPVEVRRKVLCEDAGAPVSQVWARVITSAYWNLRSRLMLIITPKPKYRPSTRSAYSVHKERGKSYVD